MCVCIVAPHSLKNRWELSLLRSAWGSVYTPKARSRRSWRARQSRCRQRHRPGLLDSRFAMGELVAADHDGDQTCNFRNRAGEQGLHCGEAGIEG